MGDYSKLIVSCVVTGEIKDELEKQVEELGLSSSAYQSQETVESIKQGTWHHRKNALEVVLVGQTKWGNRQQEFCEWLRPYVVQGSGENDVYAMSFSEYCTTPKLWSLTKSKEE